MQDIQDALKSRPAIIVSFANLASSDEMRSVVVAILTANVCTGAYCVEKQLHCRRNSLPRLMSLAHSAWKTQVVPLKQSFVVHVMLGAEPPRLLKAPQTQPFTFAHRQFPPLNIVSVDRVVASFTLRQDSRFCVHPIRLEKENMAPFLAAPLTRPGIRLWIASCEKQVFPPRYRSRVAGTAEVPPARGDPID